jgi:hypothetical protein
MSLLKEFFIPKGKSGKVVAMAILVTFICFVGFEGYAFIKIAENPFGLNAWHTTDKMPTDDWSSLRDSELFSTPNSMSGHTIFAFDLYHLRTLNVTIEFNAFNSILDGMVLVSGKSEIVDNTYPFFPNNMTRLTSNNTIQLNLRDMHYPNDYDILFIVVQNMASEFDVIQLYHRVTLNG